MAFFVPRSLRLCSDLSTQFTPPNHFCSGKWILLYKFCRKGRSITERTLPNVGVKQWIHEIRTSIFWIIVLHNWNKYFRKFQYGVYSCFSPSSKNGKMEWSITVFSFPQVTIRIEVLLPSVLHNVPHGE